jgi:hypothetical protein
MWYSPSYGLIKTPRAITKDGVQHPAQIFRQWSASELANIGFHPARLETSDNRYYNTSGAQYTFDDVASVWTISYGATERNIDAIKKSMKAEVTNIASSTLAQSDWRSIREHDGGTAMSDVWRTYRANVRAMSNTKEAEIDALSNLDAVKAYQSDPIVEVRYTSTYDSDGKETIGPDTKSYNRAVDKVNFGWPTAPDSKPDPYHVRYE